LYSRRASVPEIRDFLTADSLAYLSTEGMHRCVGDSIDDRNFCNACFTGVYSSGREGIQSRLNVIRT
jgi:amidophosphoribosyltransferase